MASGYEKSDELSDRPGSRRCFVKSAIAVGEIIAFVLGLW